MRDSLSSGDLNSATGIIEVGAQLFDQDNTVRFAAVVCLEKMRHSGLAVLQNPPRCARSELARIVATQAGLPRLPNPTTRHICVHVLTIMNIERLPQKLSDGILILG